MPKVFYSLLIILSFWLGLSTFIFDINFLEMIVALGAAIFVIIFSAVGIKKKGNYPSYAIIGLGIGLVLWGIVGIVTSNSIGMGINEIVVGILYAFVAYIISQLFVFPYISAVDRTGDTLTTIKNVKVKGDLIVVDAVLLNSMPSKIIVRPEELWKLLPLIESNVVYSLPRLLYKGWKETKKQIKKEKTS